MSLHHTFDMNLAAELKSVELALLCHHFEYWVSYNSRMKRNFHDGKFWTYQSLKEICEHFPYWSRKQVERLMEKMFIKGILEKGNFNKTKFDRTVWYTFSDKWYEKIGKSISRNREMEIPKSGNGNPEIGTPIPHTKTDTKTYSKEYSPDRLSASEQRPAFSFSLSSKKFEHITDSDMTAWKIAYPDIAIPREIIKAEQWLLANPTKARKKNWRKFLVGWLTRASDKSENRKAYRSQIGEYKIDRRTKNVDGTPVDSPVDGLF